MNEAAVDVQPAHSRLVVTTSHGMTRHDGKVITGSGFLIPHRPDFLRGEKRRAIVIKYLRTCDPIFVRLFVPLGLRHAPDFHSRRHV